MNDRDAVSYIWTAPLHFRINELYSCQTCSGPFYFLLYLHPFDSPWPRQQPCTKLRIASQIRPSNPFWMDFFISAGSGPDCIVVNVRHYWVKKRWYWCLMMPGICGETRALLSSKTLYVYSFITIHSEWTFFMKLLRLNRPHYAQSCWETPPLSPLSSRIAIESTRPLKFISFSLDSHSLRRHHKQIWIGKRNQLINGLNFKLFLGFIRVSATHTKLWASYWN